MRRVAALSVRDARAGRVGRDRRARHAADGPAAVALPALARARRGRRGGRVLGQHAARRLLVHARLEARLLGRHGVPFRFATSLLLSTKSLPLCFTEQEFASTM